MPDRLRSDVAGGLPGDGAGQLHVGCRFAEAWVWTTFNTYQWDLNYANPDVFVEMLKAMLVLANAGISEVLRIDAVAFTWKRMGTNCQNQPEAHPISQAFRSLLWTSLRLACW